MTVLETVSSYCAGSITKEEAEGIISKYDISDKAFKENIKDKIKEIQKKDKPAKGSFIDKKEQSKETKNEESDADTSIGLMTPNADDKGEE